MRSIFDAHPHLCPSGWFIVPPLAGLLHATSSANTPYKLKNYNFFFFLPDILICTVHQNILYNNTWFTKDN
ncbi:hypothetical protein I7I48_11494 [Histoplasma ohiense]|nr:hypothetical protein I7I48_11494 [Histoplasma ohiense (nom. inval.)]